MSDILLSRLLGPSFHALARDVFRHGHTHYDLSGGRGSLKSSTVSLLVPLLLIQNPDAHALVLRKVANTIRDSVYAQYAWAIGELGMGHLWRAMKAPLEFVYRPTGQKIMFRGADDPMKIKSIKVPFGYIAVTHFEEKDQFAGRGEIRTILQSTMRGGGAFWNFESYNPPISRDNWANLDSLEVREDRLLHRSCYLDAPREWLGEQFLAEAEHLKRLNEKSYRHEYLGEPVGTGSEVFENLRPQAIDPEAAARVDRILRGVDWGFFPDPWAFNAVYYDAARQTLYIMEEMTAFRKGNQETTELLKAAGLSRGDTIVADSAEPKSIADYNRYGLRCLGAGKGPGSVGYSMKWLQSLKAIVIDPQKCPDTWREFSQYQYERTRDGEIISGYPDANNHHIDAVRYATERVWRRPGSQGGPAPRAAGILDE
ncbi:MAG: PBSX family phage terminase large subunit [Clostridia bacterium]|nr:PBSX family phage terminase large subunit [Clostridia bacterium]